MAVGIGYKYFCYIFMLNLLCQLVRTAFSNSELELFSVVNSDLYMFPQMTVLPHYHDHMTINLFLTY